MSALPKVTVISVFHNRQDSVRESILSLINQDYENLDIIIVDDMSSDCTLDEIQKVSGASQRVRIVRNETNKGLVQSLIDVINDIDSKYVAIHGSGDISFPKRIQTQVSFLESNPQAGVVSVAVVNRPHDNISSSVREIKLKDLLRRNYINHGTAMFRISDYRQVGGYRSFFTQRQDKDLWYRMSLVTKLYFLPEKLYKWTKQDVSVSTQTGKSLIPSLISEFATFLIKERIVYGHDSLDLYKEKAALIFNPATSNHIFLRDLKYNLIRGRFDLALKHLNGLLKINTSLILRIIFMIIKFAINIIQFISKPFIKQRT